MADFQQLYLHPLLPLVPQVLSDFPLSLHLYCPPWSRGLASQCVCFYKCHQKPKRIHLRPTRCVWKPFLTMELAIPSSWDKHFSVRNGPGFAFDHTSRGSCVFPHGSPPRSVPGPIHATHSYFRLDDRWGQESVTQVWLTAAPPLASGIVHSIQDEGVWTPQLFVNGT